MICALSRTVVQRCAIAALAVVLTASVPAYAQQVVGRSVVEGRKVDLMSDGTWRYTDVTPDQAQCDSLPLRVNFCGMSDGWSKTTAPSAEIAAQYRFDDRHYGQFIIEGLGTDDGMNMTFYLDAVISNAAVGAGVPKDDIAVLDVRDDIVSGRDAQTIVYQLAFDGLEVVFVNTIALLPKRSIQTMTFSINTEETDRSRALHAQFLAQTRIDE